MSTHNSPAGSRTYWLTWGILLVLTIVMLGLDVAPLPKALFVFVMIAAMLVKAILIGGVFMHLRSERTSLIVMIIVGLIVTGLFLFALMVPDALRIAEMTAG